MLLKIVEKAEKELARTRQKAYDDATRKAEKFADIIVDTNKKLAEQRTKIQELKKEAIRTIEEIEEKMKENTMSYHEKLAKRYKDIFKEIKEEIGVNDRDSIYAGWSDEKVTQALENGQIQINKKRKKEFDLIKQAMSGEELKKAITKENRTETEKITEEYEKQKKSLEAQKSLYEAIRDERYATKKDGSIAFFDKDGKSIEAINTAQKKEFEAEAKKLQDIANAELKIHTEKQDKIQQIVEDFEKERKRLNENYFEEDKEMRLKQQDMMEKFFPKEIAKRKELLYLVGNFSRNFSSGDTSNLNTESDNKISTKSIGVPENTFKNEGKTLNERIRKNEEILQKYQEIVARIEGNITNTTENEINRRMSLYAQEESRLNRLIAKRIQAGYTIANVPREFQNINNVVHHSPNISVNAVTNQSIDANTLANTMIKKVNNYYKGVK